MDPWFDDLEDDEFEDIDSLQAVFAGISNLDN